MAGLIDSFTKTNKGTTDFNETVKSDFSSENTSSVSFKENDNQNNGGGGKGMFKKVS